MKTFRLTIILALVAAASVSSFAQTTTVFRAHGNGLWTDPSIWEVYNGSVWLPALKGEFPGEAHNRDVNVVIADGSTIILDVAEIPVEINSLVVGNANLTIKGSLVVGATKNEARTPQNPLSAVPAASPTTDGPSLLQNMPNPVFSQNGETAINFYLDKSYDFVRLSIYDDLGNKIMSVVDLNATQAGWHNVRFAVTSLRSGSYPIYLELPGKVLHRLMSVVK